ncbi:MAG: nuclear transport factor 2 family protein [Spirochaetales bacterium]|nr:MAG: nuclear transport factor 2 family protein [Spirochaetales bacterium]
MSPMKMSRIESGLRVVIEYIERFNRHDVEGMMRLVSDDCVFENALPVLDGGALTGKDAIRVYLTGLIDEAPEIRIDVEELFGMGMRCVLRWNRFWTGSAGENARLRGVDIFKVANGLIREQLSYVKK